MGNGYLTAPHHKVHLSCLPPSGPPVWGAYFNDFCPT